MLLIVTRPAAQAAGWVQALQALGQPAAALPLMTIGPPLDAAPVQAVWQRLADIDFVMFVSANAVEHFFAQAPAGAVWPEGTRAGSTGPGTTAALAVAGVPATARVEPDPAAGRFDSEALWLLLSGEEWTGRHALIVRGEDGRDWLAETLRARGASVEFVAAYRRGAPQFDSAQQALLQVALTAPDDCLWYFSSSDAVGNLRALAPTADWSRSAAVASHPRIAAAARAAGFGRVQMAGPTPAEVAALAAAGASIQSAPQ